MRQKEYEIGGKTFVQRPLVLGQLKQVIDLVAGLQMTSKSNIAGVVAILAEADLLPRALAIVLSEPDKRLKDKDLEAFTAFMAENADYLTTLEVVEGFFELTRPDFIFGKLTELSGQIRSKITGLTNSSAPSPGETSPGGTPSFGDTPSGSANPT